MELIVIQNNVPFFLKNQNCAEPNYICPKGSKRIEVYLNTLPQPLPDIIKIYVNDIEMDQNCVEYVEGKDRLIINLPEQAKYETIFLCYHYDSILLHNVDEDINATARSINRLVDENNCLLVADNIINSRQEQYGSITQSFKEAAALCNLIFTREEISDGAFTPQKVVKVMLALKQVRDRYSPTNHDHIRDICGYNRILEILRQEAGYYD